MLTKKAPQRERVRELLAAGLNPREIARLLDISTQRVYQHKAALMKDDSK